MAIGVLTATSLVPSGTRILPSVPSSTASTSMVALSVSISAMTSPDLTGSPSFLSHLARLPFSIVGDSAGINTSVGMAAHNGRGNGTSVINVGIKFCGIGLGVVSSEFRRLVDEDAHRGVDFFQIVFARPFFIKEPLADLLDRIVFGAHFVDFFLGSVLGGIGHRVAAIAVSHHFQNYWPLASATPSYGLIAGRFHRARVHHVDFPPSHF